MLGYFRSALRALYPRVVYQNPVCGHRPTIHRKKSRHLFLQAPRVSSEEGPSEQSGGLSYFRDREKAAERSAFGGLEPHACPSRGKVEGFLYALYGKHESPCSSWETAPGGGQVVRVAVTVPVVVLPAGPEWSVVVICIVATKFPEKPSGESLSNTRSEYVKFMTAVVPVSTSHCAVSKL